MDESEEELHDAEVDGRSRCCMCQKCSREGKGVFRHCPGAEWARDSTQLMQLLCKHNLTSRDLSILEPTLSPAAAEEIAAFTGQYRSEAQMQAARRAGGTCPDRAGFHLPCGPFQFPAANGLANIYVDTITRQPRTAGNGRKGCVYNQLSEWDGCSFDLCAALGKTTTGTLRTRLPA